MNDLTNMSHDELMQAIQDIKDDRARAEKAAAQRQAEEEARVLNDMLAFIHKHIPLNKSLRNTLVTEGISDRGGHNSDGTYYAYTGKFLLDLADWGFAPIRIELGAFRGALIGDFTYRIGTTYIFNVLSYRGHVNDFYDESLGPVPDNPQVYTTTLIVGSYGWAEEIYDRSEAVSEALMEALVYASELGNNKQEELDRAMRMITKDRDD